MKKIFLFLIIVLNVSCVFYQENEKDIKWKINFGENKVYLDDDKAEALYYIKNKEEEEITLKFTSVNQNIELIYENNKILVNENFNLKISNQENITLKNNGYEKEYKLSFTTIPIIEINSPNPSDELEKLSLIKIENNPKVPMTMEIRGQTSAYYPKKPYNIEFLDDDLKDSKNYTLFDMRKDDDWMIDAAYVDKSLIRNRVSNDLFNEINELPYKTKKGKSAIDGKPIELFLNGNYEGIYILSEKMDRKLLDLDKKYGRLYKASSEKLHRNKIYTHFEMKYPKENLQDKGFEELTAMLDSIKKDGSFDNFEKLFEVEQVINYHLLLLILSATDNFEKNYFLAKDEESKFFFVPWDLDATLGKRFDGVKIDEKRWIILPIISEALKSIQYKDLLKKRWDELKGNKLSVEYILEIFDNYYLKLLESGAYQRNYQKWKIEQRGSFDYDFDAKDIYADEDNYIEDREYIQKWLQQRYIWLDNKIKGE
ncbi:MAG: hypothetical protein B6I28_04025 [Fusobacteriia bacterium 4572_132]|nr:MAG: hypothetical protein B6I28_04025 [Fusobacteriia bacterium 4572_132]